MLTIEKLEMIFPDFPVPAMILTPDDDVTILKANHAYLDMLGTGLEELCGRPLFEVFPDDEIENPESAIKRSHRVIQEAVSAKEPKTPGAIAYALPDVLSGVPTLRFFIPEFIPVVDDKGKVCYIFHFTHEVKGQLATSPPPKDTIIASFESILETAHNAFLLTTGEGRVLIANQAACKLFGYSKAEFRKAKRQDLLDYNDERLHALLLERERKGTAKGEITGIRRNGGRFSCEYSTSRFIDANGEMRCCTEIVDLSRWKEEEARIRRSELDLKTIFNSTPDGFVLLNKDLNIVACNDKANEFVLLNSNHETADFHLGSSILGYIEEERQRDFQTLTHKVLQGEIVTYERCYQRRDGQVYWFNFSIQPVWERQVVTGLCISGRDITAQKYAEQEVVNSERRFRRLVENNMAAIAILSADYKVLYVSPAGQQITGYTEAEARQVDNLGAIHEEDLSTAISVMVEVMENPGKPIKASPIRIKHKDGSWRWIEATITNMLHDPAIGGIVDNFWDVTERIRSERRLIDARHMAEQSEIKYRKIFNQSPLPKWIYDVKSLEILEVNEAAVRHYGYSRKEFLSMTILDIRPREDRQEVKIMVRDLPESKPASTKYWRHLKKNGEIISVDIYGHPIEFNNYQARMVVCRDVTERLAYLKAVEAQNQQLREIAWHQSHIVRAPLARIIGLVYLLANEQTEANLKEILPMIERSAEDLDEVIREIIDKTKTIHGNNSDN